MNANARAPFQVMVKPRGPICNLACEYCYFLSKEKLYPGSEFRMSDELLVDFTRQLISAHKLPELTFAWQGGEPTLMGLDFFRRAVSLQKRYCKPGMRINNALQTNGVALSEDWAHFFKDEGFLVGISLDGPRELHDAYRVDRGKGPSFARAMTGLELLKKHGVEFNVLTTVNAANQEHPRRVYEFLRDQVGARFIQFIPIVEHIGEAEVTNRSVSPFGYGSFLSTIFDLWVQRDVGRVYVQIFEMALAAWSGHRSGLCVFEPSCGSAMVMEHNGDLYSCDHYVEAEHLLGNIRKAPLTSLAWSEAQQRFGNDKFDGLSERCKTCRYRFACNGGCPKNRFVSDQGQLQNYLCEGYLQFFSHADKPMRFMATELEARRPPANIMGKLPSSNKRIGRNEPCPCGSGRKYKRCHQSAVP